MAFIGVMVLLPAILLRVDRHPAMVGPLTGFVFSLTAAAWVLSKALPDGWLDKKRTIALAGLLSVGLVAYIQFGGGDRVKQNSARSSRDPVDAKTAQLIDEQDQLFRRFAVSQTCKTLLQPASFASPEVAATSLADFEHYATAAESLNDQEEALVQQEVAVDDLKAFFVAFRVWASATEELYRFAAEPSRRVHVKDGVVVVAEPDEFNRRMDAVHNAQAKLGLASAGLRHEPRGTSF